MSLRVTLCDKVDPHAWSDPRQREAASAAASPRHPGDKAPRLEPTERPAATAAAAAFLSPDPDDGVLAGAENCLRDALEAEAWTELAPHRQSAYSFDSQTFKLNLLSPAECDAMPRSSRSHGAPCPPESEPRNRARSEAR